MRGGEVSVGPLREAFARSGMTVCQIARIVGVDEHVVARILTNRGYYLYKNLSDGTRVRYGPYRNAGTCSYENAVRLALAMGVDPVEVGA